MNRNRLEGFSDGVLAIVITIMVLEMEVPHQTDFASLQRLLPVLLSYVLSFLYLGIYWNNHHYMIYTVQQVNGGILWANLHLLFWLSLVPFATSWMGQTGFAPTPVALYGGVLLMAALAHWLLQQQIIRTQGTNSPLARAVGYDWKGKVSMLLYLVAIASTFLYLWIAESIYVIVALVWLVPDKRIENELTV